MTIKKLFEMLNRLNGTPSRSDFKLDAKIKHKESTNAILTKPNGEKVDIGKRKSIFKR